MQCFFILIAVRVIRATLNCSCPQELPSALVILNPSKMSDFGHELHKFSLQGSSLHAAQRHITLTGMERWGWIWGIHGPSGIPFVFGKG